MNTVIKKTHQIDRLSKKYLPLLIILQCYSPIVSAIKYGKMLQLYNYTIYGILAIFSLIYFWVHRNKLIRRYPKLSALYVFMIIYVIVASVKLYYVPSSIFFFQRLVLFCNFLSIGTIFLLMQEGVIKRILRMWWRYVPWITLASFPFIDKTQSISMLFFTFLFIMLAECLRRQLRFLSYALLAFITLFSIYQRMDYLYVLAPLAVYFMIRFEVFMSYSKSLLVYNVQMCLPVLFFFIALFGNFNVLNFNSYIKGEYTTNTGENMKDDTRTFLYEEAIGSALTNNYVLLGRTPGYGYDSKFVKTREGDYDKVEGVKAQRNSEVFIVNIFTWCGLVGLIAWFAFYYWFGIRTLMHAKNNYVRGLVLYVGMFWICSWFSNNFCAPDNSFMMLYIILAICMQPQFPKMTNEEIRLYFRRMLH